jgi:hypothetical protein
LVTTALHNVASSAPLWDYIATVVNDTVRTLVILVAGAVGYVRFVRGRVAHSNLALSIGSEIIKIRDAKAMKVTVTIKNSGSYRMAFPLTCKQLVKVECASHDLWTKAAPEGEVNWSEAEAQELNLLKVEGVTRADETLEPGEKVIKCRLMPIPQGRWAAYRITLRVSSCARMIWRTKEPLIWETHTIMDES